MIDECSDPLLLEKLLFTVDYVLAIHNELDAEQVISSIVDIAASISVKIAYLVEKIMDLEKHIEDYKDIA